MSAPGSDRQFDPVAAELAKRAAKLATAQPDPGNKRKVRTHWVGHLADFVTWPVAFVLDRNDRPSTSKVMAFAILGLFAIGESAPTTVVIALLAASFGYTAWKDFVAKGSWGAQATDNVALSLKHEMTEHVEHTIAEQRYTTDGSGARVPAVSLPPVPDAKTPSGDD